MAARVRAHASAAFSFAIKSSNAYTRSAGAVEWGLKMNPVQAIPSDPEANRAGKRHLSPEEFRKFWDWLGTRQEKSITSFVLRVMMATGQRATEISGLTVEQYDRAERMLDWSKTKNGMPHAIPLPPQAVAVLDCTVPSRSGLIFPRRDSPDLPPTMSAVEKAVNLFIKQSNVPHFTPRDLRRTWKTLAGAAGLSKEIRDRIQNHSRNNVSSRHYDRYEYLPEKRAAMAQWADYLDRILNDGNVVPFPARTA